MKQNSALKVFALLAVSIGLLPVRAGALPMTVPQKSNLIVAVPGRDGERPRRVEVAVPAE